MRISDWSSDVCSSDLRWLTANGLNYQALLIFCFVFGMGGAFISLALSKTIAKWSTGAKVLKEPRSSSEMWLLQTVERQARAAGIGMPEVAIFEAAEQNAFATGMHRKNALGAGSTGLLDGITWGGGRNAHGRGG